MGEPIMMLQSKRFMITIISIFVYSLLAVFKHFWPNVDTSMMVILASIIGAYLGVETFRKSGGNQ
ncbi:MAG: hypothetical protein QXX08_07330 [Candidatus Bathyarchaeia archaeon]